MPEPLNNISCKLNSTYLKALEDNRFYKGTKTISGFYGGYKETGLKDRKHPRDMLIDLTSHQLGCCGLHELDFNDMNRQWNDIKNKVEEDFDKLIARYIDESIGPGDNRMTFVGIPTRVGLNSQYNIEFYRKLRTTLKKFGYIELCEPYKNVNSGNYIIAMAGQLP